MLRYPEEFVTRLTLTATTEDNKADDDLDEEDRQQSRDSEAEISGLGWFSSQDMAKSMVKTHVQSWFSSIW